MLIVRVLERVATLAEQKCWFRLSLALLFLGFGSLMTIAEIFALIDPAGSKMADDNDPFGPLPTLTDHLIYIGAIFIILSVGLAILFLEKPTRKQKNV